MHLINYFDDLKDASWAELQAYMQLTGIEIPPGECRIIVNLGQVQENMLHKAIEANCPAPYVNYSIYSDPKSLEDLEKQSEKITSSFIAQFKKS